MKIGNVILGLVALAAMTFGLIAPAVAEDFNINQFGAVSYLDDSGFYGVIDSPAMTGPGTALEAIEMIVAVDNSISALCQAGADESYSRPGGFCDAVANNKTMLPQGNGGLCPGGMVVNPTPPPTCIPEPEEVS